MQYAKLNMSKNDSSHQVPRVLEHEVYLSIKHIKNYLVDLSERRVWVWDGRWGSPGLQTVSRVAKLPWQG